MREDTCTCEIKEVFTPEEFAEIGKKLCGKLADLETVASEKKAADATFNERKKVLESEIETLYCQYNKGYEMAQIGCDPVTIRRQARSPSIAWTRHSTLKPSR